MSKSMTNTESQKRPKWGELEKQAWLAEQTVQRSYFDDVISKINPLRDNFNVQQYGVLSYAPEKYPLFCIKNLDWSNNKKTVLITGGVHGYETSGVHGALRFLESESNNYTKHFNIVVAPCVSPWGYETINRWNPHAVDPNRSFLKRSSTHGLAEESLALMTVMNSLKTNSVENQFFAHFDLHETTDTDNTVFRPALEARDGKIQDLWDIPDGFYLVGNADKPQNDFQSAIINSVKQVTHIAPADNDGRIIGEKTSQHGVINFAVSSLGLCAGYSQCEYSTTTEVYPDSPRTDAEECIEAQVAAVKGGLDYLIANQG